MRVLVDITHPVNVHFFKHLIWQLQDEGHAVLVTARDKDVAVELLCALGIEHVCISRRSAGLIGMALELVERDLRLLDVARAFRPDVMVAAEAGVSIGPVGAALGVPRVVFEQVDLAPLQRALGLPFATFICTGTGYLKQHGSRQARFRGFLAHAYLDPRRFRPDPEPLLRYGVNVAEPYVILRQVSWSATHDVGRRGMFQAELAQAIRRLERFGRVWVSSESPLPAALREYENPVPAAHFHNLLAFARMCVAEGGTVAVEAGMLGTPAICCHSYNFGYLQALEKRYGVIRRTCGLAEALTVAEELAASGDARRRWRDRSRRMFAHSEDVLAFMRRMVARAAALARAGRNGRNAQSWTPNSQILAARRPTRLNGGADQPYEPSAPLQSSACSAW